MTEPVDCGRCGSDQWRACRDDLCPMRRDPGVAVNASGQLVYDWPPQGRFVELWERVAAVTTAAERVELGALIRCEMDATSELVAFTDFDGDLRDIDWTEPTTWGHP